MTTIIVGLSVINLLGVKWSKVVNNLATLGKLIPLIIFIIAGVFFIKGGNFHQLFHRNYHPPHSGQQPY